VCGSGLPEGKRRLGSYASDGETICCEQYGLDPVGKGFERDILPPHVVCLGIGNCVWPEGRGRDLPVADSVPEWNWRVQTRLAFLKKHAGHRPDKAKGGWSALCPGNNELANFFAKLGQSRFRFGFGTGIREILQEAFPEGDCLLFLVLTGMIFGQGGEDGVFRQVVLIIL